MNKKGTKLYATSHVQKENTDPFVACCAIPFSWTVLFDAVKREKISE